MYSFANPRMGERDIFVRATKDNPQIKKRFPRPQQAVIFTFNHDTGGLYLPGLQIWKPFLSTGAKSPTVMATPPKERSRAKSELPRFFYFCQNLTKPSLPMRFVCFPVISELLISTRSDRARNTNSANRVSGDMGGSIPQQMPDAREETAAARIASART